MTHSIRPASRSEAKPLWRPIPSAPNYEASVGGAIRRKGANCPLKPCQGRGYLRVNLFHNGKGKSLYVHRLVCEAFSGPPPFPKLDAAHQNGVRHDNRPINLRWKTRAENEFDKRRHGLNNAGARNGRAKLTDNDVREIRGAMKTLPRSTGGAKIKKGAIAPLAAKYGVSASCLRQIYLGRRWGHLA